MTRLRTLLILVLAAATAFIGTASASAAETPPSLPLATLVDLPNGGPDSWAPEHTTGLWLTPTLLYLDGYCDWAGDNPWETAQRKPRVYDRIVRATSYLPMPVEFSTTAGVIKGTGYCPVPADAGGLNGFWVKVAAPTAAASQARQAAANRPVKAGARLQQFDEDGNVVTCIVDQGPRKDRCGGYVFDAQRVPRGAFLMDGTSEAPTYFSSPKQLLTWAPDLKEMAAADKVAKQYLR